MQRISVVALVLAVLGCATLRKTDGLPDTGTFSIIAYDTATGMWGGAVQSRVFSVGNGVLWAEASTGIVATQAVVDVLVAVLIDPLYAGGTAEANGCVAARPEGPRRAPP